MSLLNFNRGNEGRTWDGKESSRKGFIDFVKWDMNEDDLVYKFPYDNLSNGTVLMVHEGQRAFLYKNGVFYDSFNAGRHVLSTANIPFLQRVLNIPTGGESSFTAEVWFANIAVEKRNIPWGAGGIRVLDSYFQIPIKIGIRGQYGVKISDPEIFIKKMVGTLHLVTTDKISEQFRSDIVKQISPALSVYMKENGADATSITQHIIPLGNFTKESLTKDVFVEYGIDLVNFNIEAIIVDEDDPAYKKALDVVAERQRLQMLGNDYAKVRQFNIMEKAAENEGAGNLMGAGIGLGAGLNLGKIMTDAQPQTAPPPPPPATQYYIAQNGQSVGPYAISQILDLVRQNLIKADSFVWKTGLAAWDKAENFAELSSIFKPFGPPPPPPPIN